MSLNHTEIQAIRRLIKDKEFSTSREHLSPGIYPIDFTVRITGHMRVGEDTKKTPTIRIPQKRLMALLLARAGAQRPALLDLLHDCLTTAINEQVEAASKGHEAPSVSDAMEGMYADVYDAMVESLLMSLPKITERGHVVTSLAATRI